MKRLKCPKCKSLRLYLTEIGQISGSYFPEDDVYHADINGFAPFKVIANCFDCGHAWTLRGQLQITDELRVAVGGKATFVQ